MKAFLQMKLPPQSQRKGHAALTSYYNWVAKDEKGYPFLSIGSCADKTEKSTLFLSILLSLKKIGKGIKFQDITPIRATFTNTLANDINNGYPFSELTG